MATVSLCMIVKNEERVLARCLESVRECMDEIIIVDTGSSDATKMCIRDRSIGARRVPRAGMGRFRNAAANGDLFSAFYAARGCGVPAARCL